MSDYEIREAIPADAEKIVQYMRTIADEPDNGISLSSSDEFTYTVEDERRIIADFLHSVDKLFLIAVADGDIIAIADAHCKQRIEKHTASLGVTVRRGWRNQGLGTELMGQIIDWARENPQVKRLQLRVFATNERAIHLYEKLGFQREGVQRQVAFKDGAWVDMIMMAMIFEDKLIQYP